MLLLARSFLGDSGVGPWFCILLSAPWIDTSISADWRSSVAESCGITSERADRVFVELAVLHYQGAEETVRVGGRRRTKN